MSQWGQPGQPTGQPGHSGGQGPWGAPQPAQPQTSAPPQQQPAGPWGAPTHPYPQAQPGPSPYGQQPGQPLLHQQPGQPGQQPPSQQVVPPKPVPVVTTDTVAGRQVQSSLGEVIGVAVREREIGRKEDPKVAYPALLLRSRREAVAAMVEQARERGADAVVGMRFDSSEITQSLSEVVAYGTAVRLS